MKTIILAAALLAVPAIAQMPAPGPQARADDRQSMQQHSIDRGVRSGEITYKEKRKLQNQQDRIANREDAMRAKHGGVLTHHDRKWLAEHQRKAAKRIHHASTDNDVQ